MRLNEKIRAIIKSVVASQIGPDAILDCFAAVWMTRSVAARLYIRLGGRKVDVLIKNPAAPPKLIYQQAIAHGVIL